MRFKRSLAPLTFDLLDNCVGFGRVQPENLYRVCATDLHLEPAAHGNELQVRFARTERSDDSQSDLGHMRGVSRHFNRSNRTWNDRRMLPVELRPTQKTLGVRHP
jgi:hypothetical protein